MIRGLFKRYPSVKLNVLIYHEEGEWVANCLQMDLVATGNTEREVENDIIDLIKCQVVYAFQNDNLGFIFKPAPAEEWAKLQKAKKCGTRKIKIDIPDDKKESKIHPPIREVELCFA
jgi:hypothetical protein